MVIFLGTNSYFKSVAGPTPRRKEGRRGQQLHFQGAISERHKRQSFSKVFAMLCSCWGGCFGKGSETADPVTSTLLGCAGAHSKGRALLGALPPARGSQVCGSQARARSTRGGHRAAPHQGSHLTFGQRPKACPDYGELPHRGTQEGTSGIPTPPPDPTPVSE